MKIKLWRIFFFITAFFLTIILVLTNGANAKIKKLSSQVELEIEISLVTENKDRRLQCPHFDLSPQKEIYKDTNNVSPFSRTFKCIKIFEGTEIDREKVCRLNTSHVETFQHFLQETKEILESYIPSSAPKKESILDEVFSEWVKALSLWENEVKELMEKSTNGEIYSSNLWKLSYATEYFSLNYKPEKKTLLFHRDSIQKSSNTKDIFENFHGAPYEREKMDTFKTLISKYEKVFKYFIQDTFETLKQAHCSAVNSRSSVITPKIKTQANFDTSQTNQVIISQKDNETEISTENEATSSISNPHAFNSDSDSEYVETHIPLFFEWNENAIQCPLGSDTSKSHQPLEMNKKMGLQNYLKKINKKLRKSQFITKRLMDEAYKVLLGDALWGFHFPLLPGQPEDIFHHRLLTRLNEILPPNPYEHSSIEDGQHQPDFLYHTSDAMNNVFEIISQGLVSSIRNEDFRKGELIRLHLQKNDVLVMKWKPMLKLETGKQSLKSKTNATGPDSMAFTHLDKAFNAHLISQSYYLRSFFFAAMDNIL